MDEKSKNEMFVLCLKFYPNNDIFVTCLFYHNKSTFMTIIHNYFHSDSVSKNFFKHRFNL